jgi:hypothetical protein
MWLLFSSRIHKFYRYQKLFRKPESFEIYCNIAHLWRNNSNHSVVNNSKPLSVQNRLWHKPAELKIKQVALKEMKINTQVLFCYPRSVKGKAHNCLISIKVSLKNTSFIVYIRFHRRDPSDTSCLLFFFFSAVDISHANSAAKYIRK